MTISTRVRRAVVGTAIATLAVGAPMLGGRANGATMSACTNDSGVVVVVDFSHWGGAIERGCAPGQPATGLDALHDAGFTPTGTAQYGDAFVCRIDDRPSTAEQACASTPPANAYWAYYHARRTDSGWTYNVVGAASTHPAPGTIEAWAFGARALPGVTPAAAVATTATTPPPTTAKPHAAATTTLPPATSPGTHTQRTITAPTGSRAVAGLSSPNGTPTTGVRAAAKTKANTRAAAHVGRRATTVTPTTTIAAGRIVERSAAPAAPPASSGSPLPTVLTLALLAAAGVTGVVVVRARRRSAT